MRYEFPLIETINDILPAVEGREEFVVAEKDGYTVINYNVMFDDTFPPVKVAGGSAKMRAERSRINSLRRECRGIIFDSETGDIIRRPFHKFFNVNERAETQQNVVGLGEPHVILDKLDGSMIAPFLVRGKMIWGTKMGATDVAQPVAQFVMLRNEYREFAMDMIAEGVTPIFEWCSNKQRIVLDQPEDQLILTALRDMRSGVYVDHDIMEAFANPYGVPVVKAFSFDNGMDEFIKMVHDLEDVEGYVVRFDGGHMVKLKCHWYLQIHKAKEAILQDRNIAQLVLEQDLDDVKAHLPEADRDRLTKFEHDLNQALSRVVDCIMIELDAIRGMDRKTFALGRANELTTFEKQLVFKNFDVDPSREKVSQDVREVLRNNLGRTVKYDAIRNLWFPGVIYNA